MSSLKLIVVAIALLAEVCASAGPALLTICVHEDGTVRYEPTMALCCKQNEQGHGECCSHEEGRPVDDHVVSPVDSCSDYGVVFTQVPTPVTSIKQILSDNLGLCELLPVDVLAPSFPIVQSSISLGSCGPPGNHTLQDLSTVVLRI